MSINDRTLYFRSFFNCFVIFFGSIFWTSTWFLCVKNMTFICFSFNYLVWMRSCIFIWFKNFIFCYISALNRIIFDFLSFNFLFYNKKLIKVITNTVINYNNKFKYFFVNIRSPIKIVLTIFFRQKQWCLSRLKMKRFKEKIIIWCNLFNKKLST